MQSILERTGGSIKTSRQPTGCVDRTPRMTHSCTLRSSAHCPHRCCTHHANTRGSRANMAHNCALWCLLKDSVIPASWLVFCSTWHWTLLHDLFHLSSDLLLPHCLVLWNWIKKPCVIHDGVTDVLNLYLPTGTVTIYSQILSEIQSWRTILPTPAFSTWFVNETHTRLHDDSRKHSSSEYFLSGGAVTLILSWMGPTPSVLSSCAQQCLGLWSCHLTSDIGVYISLRM